MLLQNRTALVTGGGGRIGRVIAATLQKEGAAVAIVDNDAARVERALPDLQVSGRAGGFAGDVSDEAEIERLVAAAERALAPVDILVNCHGYAPNCPLVDMEVAEWDKVFAVNVRGAMLTCRQLARRWIRAGTRGAIVNISSGAGRSARAGSSHYASSKAALNMITEVLAIELGPHGIRVNAVAPGLILDEVLTAGRDDLHPYINQMLQATPLRRTGAPQDIADAVAWLASDRAGWTTGAVLEVTGGSHCGRPHVPLTRELRN